MERRRPTMPTATSLTTAQIPTAWDARNHLTAIAGPSTASFVYGPDGRRTQKAINGTSTQFLYDGLNPVQEIQNGAPSANLITGLGIDEYFQRTDSAGARDYLKRQSWVAALHSRIRPVTVQTQYSYDPFGNSAASGQASSNPYQFTGRENDGTGLDYYRARYYSPSVQRFVSQDPKEFAAGDVNLYSYVQNDPLSYVDPEGLQPDRECNWWEGLACVLYCGPGNVFSCTVPRKYVSRQHSRGDRCFNSIFPVDAGPPDCTCNHTPSSGGGTRMPTPGPYPYLPPVPVF